MVMGGMRCIVWAAWRGFGVPAVDPRGPVLARMPCVSSDCQPQLPSNVEKALPIWIWMAAANDVQAETPWAPSS